jgi:hypothetical protein
MPDLFDPEAALAGEYDGAQHRSLAAHTDDNAREESFERIKVTVARATSIDLWPRRDRLIWRLREAHRRASTRDRARDRWRLA